MLEKIHPMARGPYDTVMFRTDVDEEEFRQYARENSPPESREECNIMHPYCRDEWYKMGVLPEIVSFSI